VKLRALPPWLELFPFWKQLLRASAHGPGGGAERSSAQRKKTERPAVKMAAAVSLIDSILELDRKAPRKQRHTVAADL